VRAILKFISVRGFACCEKRVFISKKSPKTYIHTKGSRTKERRLKIMYGVNTGTK